MRILIVSYYFPPLNKIASHRPYSWAKTWLALGHDVHVLTTAKHAFDGSLDLDYDLSGLSVHIAPFLGKAFVPKAASDQSADAARASYWDRFKIATRTLRLGFGMFAEIASLGYFSLLRTGLAVLQSAKFDFIVSTSPPEVTHFVAHALSARAGVPWAADYRDLWFPEMRLHQFRWVAALTGLASKRLLKSASLVSTVSQGLAARLKAFLGREIHICYNGFLAEAQDTTGPSPRPDDKIHIVYTGRVYPITQDPGPLLRALAELKSSGRALADRLAIDFYGFDEPWLRSLIKTHHVEDCVKLHGFVPYRNSVAAQRAADILLFLDWTDAQAEGVLTGKLFEYLASGRPVLALGARTDTEAARLIADVRCGITLTRHDEIMAYLQQLLGSPRPPGIDASNARAFSRERQATALLAEIVARLPRAELIPRGSG